MSFVTLASTTFPPVAAVVVKRPPSTVEMLASTAFAQAVRIRAQYGAFGASKAAAFGARNVAFGWWFKTTFA